MSDTQLVVLSVKDEAAAQQLLEQLQVIDENDENVTIMDAAIAIKSRRGRIRLKQTKDMGFVKGGLGGGAVGVIAGALVAGPFGAAVGGVLGGLGAGLFARFQDVGIEDKLMRKMARDLHAGRAALFLLFSGDWSRSNQALQATLRSHGIRYVDQSLPDSVVADVRAVSEEISGDEAAVDYEVAVDEDDAGLEGTEESDTELETIAVKTETDGDADLGTAATAEQIVDAKDTILDQVSPGQRDHILKLSRLAGELEIVSQAMAESQLPLLGAVLSVNGRRLQQAAVNAPMRTASRSRLVKAIDTDSQRAGALDETELGKTVARLAAQGRSDLETTGLPL